MNSIYSQFLPFANSCNAQEILYNLVIKDSRARHGAYNMQTHGFEQFVLILGSDKLLQVEKHKDNTYILVINIPGTGYFVYDSQPDLFMSYLQSFQPDCLITGESYFKEMSQQVPPDGWPSAKAGISMELNIRNAKAPAMSLLGDRVLNKFFINQHHLQEVYPVL